MAKATSLNLSDVHQVQPVCSGCFKKSGIEILTEGLEKYLDGSNAGTFDSSEQRQALSLPDVLSVEKTKLQRDKAKENKKHSR